MVKALGWMFAAALCVAAVPGAKADFWFDPAPGFGVPDVAPEDQGGPYFVAGFGDSIVTERKYWGGPYFVTCFGKDHPFETYRMSCRPHKFAARHRVKVHLK
jgi:hypothetical protein